MEVWHDESIAYDLDCPGGGLVWLCDLCGIECKREVGDMNNEEIIRSLQQTEDRTLRNEGRIKKLESEHATLQSLATSVAVMAEQLKTMNGNVKILSGKVENLEAKPGKRWDAIVEKAIWALLAAGIAFMLGRLGL